MIKFILIFALFTSGFASSQFKDSIVSKEEIIPTNEHPSVFPKGINAFRKMILDNFRMKKIKSQNNIFCEITFIVERDGTISNLKANGNDQSFNKEAIRAVSKITDKWISAEINGQKVRSRYRIPLNINYK